MVLFLKQIIAFFQTAFLILQIFPQMPVKPLNWASTPLVEKVEFNYNSQSFEGKLFRLNKKKHPALILSLALKSTPKDEEQLANFAQAAARLGFVVLVPHAKEVQEGRRKIEDKETFIAAFEFLTHLPYVEASKISYLGISAGSSIALKAVQDPKISQKVRAFIFFGGYFEAKDYLSSLITGKASYKETEIPWNPDPGAVLHAKELIINLAPENERPILESLLLEGETASPTAETLLSKESQFAISLFSAKSSSEFNQVWQTAPKLVHEQISRLSPSQGIEDVATRLFILHDRGDRYVSYTESRKLNEALPKNLPRTFLEVSLFEHVQPKGALSPAVILDLAKLYRFVYQTILFLS